MYKYLKTSKKPVTAHETIRDRCLKYFVFVYLYISYFVEYYYSTNAFATTRAVKIVTENSGCHI